MKDSALIRTGVVGMVIAMICCSTPLLVVFLGAVGLSAITGYLDLVLLPAIIFFLGLTIYALNRRNRRQKITSTK